MISVMWFAGIADLTLSLRLPSGRHKGSISTIKVSKIPPCLRNHKHIRCHNIRSTGTWLAGRIMTECGALPEDNRTRSFDPLHPKVPDRSATAASNQAAGNAYGKERPCRI